MTKELLFSITSKDFKIEWFSGSGAGGQHRNKHQNCCRMTHIDSGVMKSGTKHREREKNKRDAFNSIVNSVAFKKWHSIKVRELTNGLKDIETRVDESMNDDNLLIEVREDNKWVEE